MAADSSETSKRIQELQMFEHNHQALLMQKQTIQMELNEVLNALQEVQKTKDAVYKVLGGVMVQSDKSAVIKDLEERKKILELKVSAIEKQEKIIDGRISEIRNEITALVGKNKS